MIHDHSILLATNISQFTFESMIFLFPRLDMFSRSLEGICRWGLENPPLTSMPKTISWSLEFQKVHFSYQQRGVEILKDLSFQVHQGEFLGHLAATRDLWFVVFSLWMFHTPENEHVPLKRGQFQKGK